MTTNLIVGEGKDEVNFFSAFLKFHDIINWDIIEIGGKSKYRNKYRVRTKSSGFENYKAILLTRDSDGDYNKAVDSLKGILQHVHNIKKINDTIINQNGKKYGIYVFDNEVDMLEDVCLKTVETSKLHSLMANYIENIKNEIPKSNQPKNFSKAKCRAYLAGQRDDIKDLGTAALKHIWDFDSKHLKSLLDIIKTMENENKTE